MMDLLHVVKDNIELFLGFLAGRVKWGNLVQKTYYTIETLTKLGKAFMWTSGKIRKGALRFYSFARRYFLRAHQKL